MDLLFLAVLQDGNAPASSPFGGGGMTTLFFMLLLFAAFYFFLIRPQQRREKQRKNMIAAVARNDRIVTAGGIHGIVTKVDDTSVLVDVHNGTKLRIEKNALARIVNKETAGKTN